MLNQHKDRKKKAKTGLINFKLIKNTVILLSAAFSLVSDEKAMTFELTIIFYAVFEASAFIYAMKMNHNMQ